MIGCGTSMGRMRSNQASTPATLSGVLNGAQPLLDHVMAMGATQVEATSALTQIVTHQAVMLSTNQLMLSCAAVFMAGAALIWLAPKPSRVEAGGFGH